MYWLVMVDYGGMESRLHIFVTDGWMPRDCRIQAGPFTDAGDLLEALNAT